VSGGAFIRQQAAFRGWPEPGAPPSRYHLYVALACPWSHRTVIVRKLAGVDIGVSYAHPYRDERGWRLVADEVNGFEFLAEAYRDTDPDYDDRISVPVLWDKETESIVSNESADIVRMLDAWGDAGLYPEELREEIESLNEWIYGDLQNGVYRAGFARSQEAYDEAFDGVFAALERLEALLGERRYLTGDRLTLADWRLFPTLVRDVVYHTQPGVADTVAMDQIREHYYTTHDSLNPKRIIPRGPLDLDFTT